MGLVYVCCFSFFLSEIISSCSLASFNFHKRKGCTTSPPRTRNVKQNPPTPTFPEATNCLRTPNEWLGWKRRRVLEAVALAADEDAAAAAFCERRRFPAGKEPSEAASARRSGVFVSVNSTLQLQLARALFPSPSSSSFSPVVAQQTREGEKRKGKTAVSPSNQKRKGRAGLGCALHDRETPHPLSGSLWDHDGRERKRQVR